VSETTSITPQVGGIGIVGIAPTTKFSFRISVPEGSVSAEGYRRRILLGRVITPSAGSTFVAGGIAGVAAHITLPEPQAWKILNAEPRRITYKSERRAMTVAAPSRRLTYGGTMGGWQALKEIKAVDEILHRDFDFAGALKRGDTVASCEGTIVENGTSTDKTTEMLVGVDLYASSTKVAWSIQAGEPGKAYDLILVAVSAAGQTVQEIITFKVE
jgi:hypothetical protein